MPITLIAQKPDFIKKVEGSDKLSVAELFADTIQGEGISTGVPSTFLRLQGCVLECIFCDTLEVWRYGNEYSFEEIFQMFKDHGLIDKFKLGQHLVLTGGSPLKQQRALANFILAFRDKYGFKPFIEIENECVLEPSNSMILNVDQWNNSPKLANSGMKERVRYKPEIVKKTAYLKNSWFKFVVDCEEDWEEIREFYSDILTKSQIILMPEGQTQDELNKSREIAVNMSIKHGVRYSDRAHITIWNKKTGV